MSTNRYTHAVVDVETNTQEGAFVGVEAAERFANNLDPDRKRLVVVHVSHIQIMGCRVKEVSQ